MKRFLALLLPLAVLACAPVTTVRPDAIDPIAVGQQVLAVERAYAERVQREGWAVFRELAAPDAVIFDPEPVNALQWTPGPDEPDIRQVRWQTHRVILSCDGRMAATTGAAQWPDGRDGSYVMIWRREANGRWRWVTDRGVNVVRALTAPPAPAIEIAECPGSEGPVQRMTQPGTTGGSSPDATLVWDWIDSAQLPGVRVSMWIGPRYTTAIEPMPDVP